MTMGFILFVIFRGIINASFNKVVAASQYKIEVHQGQ
jgi:hypothetical protein